MCRLMLRSLWDRATSSYASRLRTGRFGHGGKIDLIISDTWERVGRVVVSSQRRGKDVEAEAGNKSNAPGRSWYGLWLAHGQWYVMTKIT